jgi:hypothetical protein
VVAHPARIWNSLYNTINKSIALTPNVLKHVLEAGLDTIGGSGMVLLASVAVALAI